jgi:hypothetical protein
MEGTMKRLASLIAVVFAFAIVPVALADTTQPPAKPAGAPVAKLRLDLLRLRLDIVHLRYRIVCHDRSSDACTQFTQQIVDRLTTLDGNVQQKLAGCTTGDKKCTVLQKVDARLQKIIDRLSNPTSSSSASTSESGLDQAAGDLAGLAKP